MKIGILGGTFNPFHKGHLNLAKKVYSKFNLDEVWIVPTYKTPNKGFFPEKINVDDRIKMIKAEIDNKKYKWLKINDYEASQKRISYTIDTINHFTSKYPDSKFYLLMGDDAYSSFETWKGNETILEKVELIVYKRYGISESDRQKFPMHYIDDVVYNVSSRDILNNLLWEEIPTNTKKYIAKNRLYLKSVVFYKLYDTAKFEHSLSVASYAKRLAEKNKYKDLDRAYYAGLTHDLFKYEDNSYLIRFISTNSSWELPPKEVMHAYAAALWLESFYWINDDELTQAVKKHTVPDDNMSMLDKIIYVADKISSDRSAEEIKHLRKMAFMDLDETFKKLLEKQYKEISERKIKISDSFQASYNKYVLDKKIKKEKKLIAKKYEFFRKIN